MKSHHIRIPNYDMPIRFRPWFLVFTVIIIILLAFLGFTKFSQSLPLNDKLLHFLCFSLATGVFYFIFDVEEHAKRIWFWKHSPLIFTLFLCFLCGGILSEFVQSALPYKEFQIGDIIANLLGSSVGLCASYYMERYYRRRREIARLYQPLNLDSAYDQDDEEEELYNTQLLPMHHQNAMTQPKANKGKSVHFKDVWDEQEELFGIGSDTDEEAEASVAASNGHKPSKGRSYHTAVHP